MLSTASDILNPIDLAGASPIFHISAKYLRTKNGETPADGTALFSATASTPLDQYGVNTFTTPLATSRPLYKTTEGFKTIQAPDNSTVINGLTTLFKNNTTALSAMHIKCTSFIAGNFVNVVLGFQNPLSNGTRYTIYIESDKIIFLTNVNDSGNTGNNSLFYYYPSVNYLLDKYITLICFQDYVGGTKKIWLNNRLVASTTTTFGVAVPNTNNGITAPFGNVTNCPTCHLTTSAMVKDCSEPTSEEIRKINNWLLTT